MASAREQAAAFQRWHQARTWEPDHPEIDPWLRGVLLALQVALNDLAEQIDANTARLERLERQFDAIDQR
jgi:hypothetical protein